MITFCNTAQLPFNVHVFCMFNTFAECRKRSALIKWKHSVVLVYAHRLGARSITCVFMHAPRSGLLCQTVGHAGTPTIECFAKMCTWRHGQWVCVYSPLWEICVNNGSCKAYWIENCVCNTNDLQYEETGLSKLFPFQDSNIFVVEHILNRISHTSISTTYSFRYRSRWADSLDIQIVLRTVSTHV